MISMEFGEVVSPHVAIPVVLVLVCAVLVFAFGFRSPIPPPSLDVLDDHDERKHKKLKKPKTKSAQSNGHIAPQDHGSTQSKASIKQSSSVPSGTKAAAQAKPAKSETVKKVKKPSSPSKEPQAKTVVDVARSNKNDVEQGLRLCPHCEQRNKVVKGEWTTQVSRKDKKLRQKKEESPQTDRQEAAKAIPSKDAIHSKTSTESVKREKTLPAPVDDKDGQALTSAADTELSPRSPRKKKVKKSTKPAVESPKDELLPDPRSAGTTISPEEEMENEIIKEEKTVAAAAKKPVAPVVGKSAMHLQFHVVEEIQVMSPVAKDKQKPANRKKSDSPQSTDSMEEILDTYVITPTVPKNKPTTFADTVDKKQAKSPKKKKKDKKGNTSSEKSTIDSKSTEISQPDASAHVVPVIPASSMPSSAQRDVYLSAAALLPSPSIETAESNPSTSSVNKPAQQEQAVTPVSFDEMPEPVTDTKPKIKKKKPRREN